MTEYELHQARQRAQAVRRNRLGWLAVALMYVVLVAQAVEGWPA